MKFAELSEVKTPLPTFSTLAHALHSFSFDCFMLLHGVVFPRAEFKIPMLLATPCFFRINAVQT